MTTTDYAALAATFDRRYLVSDYSGVGDALVRLAADARGRILEVGCGTGYWLELLADQGHEVVGVEPSAEMLALARARLPGVELRQASAERLPLADGSVARVYCVLHHFPDRQAFLREARRVLAPGGALLTVGLDPHTGLDRWVIYNHFEGTLAADKARFAPCSELGAWTLEAGFARFATRVVHEWTDPLPARELFERGLLDRSSTSQLADLDDAAYERGVVAMRAAMAVAERAGGELVLPWNLRLWGTVAWV